MQLPVTIGLHRSRFQVGVLVAIGLAGLLLAWMVPWGALFRVALGALTLTLAMLSWWHLKWRVADLVLTQNGMLQARFVDADNAVPVRLLPAATVHPWLTVVRLEYDAGAFSLVITPDCMSASDFRRLRVWLRWRATFVESGVG